MAPSDHIPRLTRLGTQEWNHARARVQAAVSIVAADLLSLTLLRPHLRPGAKLIVLLRGGDVPEIFATLHGMGIKTIGSWISGLDIQDKHNIAADEDYYKQPGRAPDLFSRLAGQAADERGQGNESATSTAAPSARSSAASWSSSTSCPGELGDPGWDSSARVSTVT